MAMARHLGLGMAVYGVSRYGIGLAAARQGLLCRKRSGAERPEQGP